ncbi:Ig-like domain-containing protein [Demequina sp.]|uniref:Ig-like domain-containing protein n=1 Tax=Demequina sp. TaxID=2050685 RepID=UPI003D14CD59
MTTVMPEVPRPEDPLLKARRRRLVWRSGVVVLVGAVIAGAIVAPGFDEREVVPDDPSVWALQSVEGQRFARINTVVGEVDTVKNVSAPTDLAQSGDSLLVYSDNLGTVTPVDASRPTDLDDSSSETSVATPSGTESVTYAGDFVVYLTDTGMVLAGRISDGTGVAPAQFDPFADAVVEEGAERPEFRALAATVSPNGDIAAYSAEQGAVLRASAATGEIAGLDPITDGPTDGNLQLTWAGNAWALLDASSGTLWRQGVAEPIDTGAGSGAVLAQPTEDLDAFLVTDEFGVISVPKGEGSAQRIFGADGVGLGEPAAAMQVPGEATMVAAWLPAGLGAGTMWRSDAPAVALDYGGLTLGDQRTPQLRSNGSRLILNETRSGWVWSVPSGQLIASSQQWDQDQDAPTTDDEDDVAPEVTDPRAPVAVDDSFGVRAGRQVVLPALLNDHDANKDVLTIASQSLTAIDPAFGTLSIADDDQSVIITVNPNATGTATFDYQVTDGTTSDGLLSEPATVTLRVHSASENAAPQWCGVDGCLTTWPSLEVHPGGTAAADVLTGWVDPDGDPMYLASATTSYASGVVAASPEGRVVFQHVNASASGSATAAVTVAVSDSFGATTTKVLNVSVLDEPELTVEDVSVTVVAGVTTTIDVADRVTGGVGALELEEASLAPGDKATVAVAQGVVGFTFVADDPGSHLVDFKVTDGVEVARGVARITVLDPSAEKISTVPSTAFVRAKEDATVDVLRTVSNPGGRVLLISDVSIDPAPGAQLSADVVGFSALRLSGDTPDGQPGTLGVVTYTVSDGSGRPGMTATGEVTVVLLPTETPPNPIAIDDTATVRAGTQFDTSVLRNDIGPTGTVIALDPDSIVAPEGAGLAFAGGSRLRYLAPDTPGTYVISYATYVLGYPTQRDTAQLVVTVLDNPTNSPPTPRDLTGRVASGQSVRLAFDGTRLDPDGDRVTLSRVETQPSSGIAAVSADGQAIVYTSDPGFSGQVSFTYSVVDARGQTATASVHIGVIAVEFEAKPVTYADYVQAQVGDGRSVVVVPTANDIDLAGGELELVDLSPDAPLETDEYRELADRVVSVADDTVMLRAGETPGTYSYLYTVRNSAGSTAVGRIILKAVREPVADVPVVTDTVLALDTRESLPTGVDVLTGKVSWASGDPAGLVLSLWGSQPGVTVDGWTISAPSTTAGRIIPFQVTGTNFAGEEVTSYGFLKVPGLDETRLALKDSFTEPQVVEGESVTFDIKPLVAVPADTQLVVDGDDVQASGVRKGSTCELVSGTTLRYTASEGQPYSDMCRVSARVADQDRFTLVPIPITIIPKDPSPVLRSGSIELSPGATTTFDLAGMVSWPTGAAARDVEIALNYAGQQFDVRRSGDVLTITAQDRAVPGNVDGATVSLTSDPEVPAVSLTFVVGPAPSSLPKGANITRQCSQASGSSCAISVIGGPGEVNPLPGTPLELASVTPDVSCPNVTFTVSGNSTITAWWTADAPGATCTATFTVMDAQGRVSAGDRVGVLHLDLLGYPASPAEVRQTAFGDGTLTLAVSPSPSGASYPGVTSYVIYEGATKVATCAADGSCPAITGLTNGAKHTYVAKALNSVGESRGSVSVSAWSYAPPAAPVNVTWTPTRNTGGDGKRIDIELDVTDATTKELRITSGSGETMVVPVSGKGHKSVSAYYVGSNTTEQVTITPVTSLDLPPVAGAQEQGSAVTFAANGVGAPTIVQAVPTVDGSGTTATLAVQVTSGGVGSDTFVGVLNGGTCESMVAASGGSASLTVTVIPNTTNRLKLCGESRVGSTTYGSAPSLDVAVYPWVDPGAPLITRGYRVAPECTGDGMSCQTGVTEPIVNLGALPATVVVGYRFNGGSWTTKFSNMPVGVPVTVNARLCVVFNSTTAQCSPTVGTVAPDDGYAAYRTQVTVRTCEVGVPPSVTVGASGDDYAVEWTLRDADGELTTHYDAMRTASVTVNFTGALIGIDPWTSATSTCTGVPEPSPEPSPSVSPTP